MKKSGGHVVQGCHGQGKIRKKKNLPRSGRSWGRLLKSVKVRESYFSQKSIDRAKRSILTPLQKRCIMSSLGQWFLLFVLICLACRPYA